LNSDDRHLYARLGIEALQLARQAGLSREPADAVGTLLQAALE
jgi:hypothetical protein